MRFKLAVLLFCFITLLIFCSTALSFDINSFSSGIQQKNTPEQWIKKNQIPNYDESYLNQGNLSGYEDQQKAQKFMDLANQLIQSQYTYTCSMIRKVEDKTFFQCDVDGSIYPSMDICAANCNSTYACQQEQCSYQNMCSSSQTCPLGDYPCLNNSCTQTGTCSSTQVTTTQYQCPTTGQTYSDQTTCNNNCVQTASCSSQSYTYNDTWFPPPYGGFCGVWNVDSGYALGGKAIGQWIGEYNLYEIHATIGQPDVDNGYLWFRMHNHGQNGCCQYNQYLKLAINSSGSFVYGPYDFVYNWQLNCSADKTSCTFNFYSYKNQCDSYPAYCGYYWDDNYGSYVYNCCNDYSGCSTYTPSQMPPSGYNCWFDSDANRWYCSSYAYCYPAGACGWNSISFNPKAAYTCPLGSQYSCSGSPPTCTAGQACVTQNVTTTKYQCSLTGTQYDTESQCTSACLNTANCNTNYKCTYENSIYSDASTCQANCSFYQCPSDGAYYLTAPECQNACASFICQKDGVKYTSMYDCQANCKEAGSCTAQ